MNVSAIEWHLFVNKQLSWNWLRKCKDLVSRVQQLEQQAESARFWARIPALLLSLQAALEWNVIYMALKQSPNLGGGRGWEGVREVSSQFVIWEKTFLANYRISHPLMRGTVLILKYMNGYYPKCSFRLLVRWIRNSIVMKKNITIL